MIKTIIFRITGLAVMLVLLSCSAFSSPDMPNTDTVGANKFHKNLQQYAYYIEGAGVVNFTTTSLKNGKLTTEYYYFSEGENRTGISSHQLQKDGKYVGDWKTSADNGNVYEGKSWLKFNVDGTASGRWTWKGMPGDYEVRIDKIRSSVEGK